MGTEQTLYHCYVINHYTKAKLAIDETNLIMVNQNCVLWYLIGENGPGQTINHPGSLYNFHLVGSAAPL